MTRVNIDYIILLSVREHYFDHELDIKLCTRFIK